MKPTILAGDWMDADEATRALGIKQRTLQEWVQYGFLRTKRSAREGKKPESLYHAEDVAKLQREGRPATPEQAKRAKRRNVAESPRNSAPMSLKRTQIERALDTVSIVGNLVAGHKAELEMLVGQMTRNLETVVNLILTAQKAEADANRERLKAEREDERERWELDRQDRLDRRKNRGLALVAPPPTPTTPEKARKAHA